MTADNPSQGTGVESAAQAFEALLSGNTGKQTPDKEQPSEQPDAEEAEALEASDAEEDASPDEGDPDAEEADDQGDDEGDAELDMDRLVTVTVDGKTQEIPLKEALAGYQRQSDYTRKTEALAAERRAAAEEFEAARATRAEYAQRVELLQQELLRMQSSAQPDWEKLYNEDPIEYVRQKENWREYQSQQAERMAMAQAEMQRLQHMQQEEQAAALSRMVEDNRQRLLEKMPRWRDKTQWEKDRAAIREYGQKAGFSAQEISQVYDHRAVVTLWKAMRYDDMMSKRPKPQASKTPAQAPAGSSAAVSRTTSEVTRAKQRLAKTGKVADAAALFEKLL